MNNLSMNNYNDKRVAKQVRVGTTIPSPPQHLPILNEFCLPKQKTCHFSEDLLYTADLKNSSLLNFYVERWYHTTTFDFYVGRWYHTTTFDFRKRHN